MNRFALFFLLALASGVHAAKVPAPLPEDAALLHDAAHVGIGAIVGGVISLGCEAMGFYDAHPWISRGLVFGIPAAVGILHELQNRADGGRINFEQMGMTAAGGAAVCLFRVEHSWHF